MLANLLKPYRQLQHLSQHFSGIAPLLMRLILAPVMIIAGYNKLNLSNPDATFLQRLLADPNIVAWFGNSEWGLGLPFPDLLAFLAAWAEFLGGWLILLGLLTRLVSIPLMVTMVVAATTVHLEHGWFSVTPTNPDTSAAKVLDWLGFEEAKVSLENSVAAKQRLDSIKEIVEENGRPNYLYERGNIVILNNGIEFAATYFVLLLSLFFTGGGRYVSVDYWLRLLIDRKQRNSLPE
ncbi:MULTISPECIES: HvfX family Cu-binding RiPP maturation protein [Pseudoalteromonas]|uniref:DoxX family protein n=1 Tax=Pseudoalteromonas maricaloris TaxID=184924 RepID=A0A8I2H560_9GAMM|nr:MULTISPECIES: DoxX family protein [Pseudoalteromonas]NLR21264.1 DoxX family protein [Pseudoalteromonas maricaloris]RZG16035.1 DoxX family protein [Pseudoalteromonas sp. CO342X]WOX30360.1 DoxX family protein [Pseudoalteromonas maricaloris]